MINAKVAVAGGHAAAPVTVMVRVMRPPVVWSLDPKKYVGVGVLPPLMKAPSPLELHEIVPLADVYPAGMSYCPSVMHA